MTLMKSILLGSAAGIVAVAGAQAADLPTKKAAPAEYVKICNVGGMAGFIIPGSDTCLKISGYVTAQVEAGNTMKGYSYVTTPGGMISGKALTSSAADLRPAFGYTTRLNVTWTLVRTPLTACCAAMLKCSSKTATASTPLAMALTSISPTFNGLASPLVKRLRSSRSSAAAKAGRTFSRPTSRASTSPTSFAYTATFGGGFSATIAAQSARESPGFASAAFGRTRRVRAPAAAARTSTRTPRTSA